MRLPECPFGGVNLGRLDQAHEVPDGCVVWTDGAGRDWLIFAPELVAQMRHDCPICQAEAHAPA